MKDVIGNFAPRIGLALGSGKETATLRFAHRMESHMIS